MEVYDVHRKKGKLQVRYIPANITKKGILKIGRHLFNGEFTLTKVKETNDRLFYCYDQDKETNIPLYININTTAANGTRS